MRSVLMTSSCLSSSKVLFLIQCKYIEVDKWLSVLSPVFPSIILTWDAKHDSAFYLGNSSWAEGRNKLFELATASNCEYKYIIYADGDAMICHDDMSEFVRVILAMKPVHAVPLVPKTNWSTVANRFLGLPSLAYDKDELFMALDFRIACHCFGPTQFVESFDSLSWFYPCVISQSLISNFFWRSSIVVPLRCSNASHGSYPNQTAYGFIRHLLRLSSISPMLPLSVNRGHKSILLTKVALYVDFLVSLLLFLATPALYRPSTAYSLSYLDGVRSSYNSFLHRVSLVF